MSAATDTSSAPPAAGAATVAQASAKAKSPRAPNEVDFWRGLALIAIFINHVPGIFWENYTNRNMGISDSADLFVFLAGWAMRYLSESRTENLTDTRLILRLEARAFTIYTAQILIIMLAIAMLSTAAIILKNPLVLNWHNAAAVFTDPVPAHIGIVLLTHHLGYFDILPLYVALIAFAPIIILIHRHLRNALLPLSLLLWGAVLTFSINIPTWPVDGYWFFNPMAWQLNFVLGFILAKPTGLGQWVRHHRGKVRLVGALIVGAGLVAALAKYRPNPLLVPQPYRFFIDDKMYWSPMRAIHLLGMVAFFGGSFHYIYKWAAPLGHFLATLGRNSLHVFCVGSLASLLGQIIRASGQVSLLTDTLVVIFGVIILYVTAWLNEWRTRIPG
ncbi:MAG: OpgC domain-containing protein [Hyphomicrobiales bacterium]|nr:OpgC domain-containing protein [Hyphomicrobiales bacterium]